MFERLVAPLRQTLALLILSTLMPASFLHAQDGKTDREMTVRGSLEYARGIGVNIERTESSLLGSIPGPAECADLQPDFRKLFTAVEPLAPEYDAEQKHMMMRDYRFQTFATRPRVSDCFPLGPTGAHIRDMNMRAELLVVNIEKNTPADGILQIDDIILGANGRQFRDRRDPRVPMGYAIYESQTEKLGGRLTLSIVRDGKPMNVVIPMQVLPEYSATWPYNCPRTEQLASALTDFAVENEPGRLFSLHGGGGYWGPLFMMSTGDDRALEITRRHLDRALHREFGWEPDATKGGHSWNMAYGLVSYCEYYLLTGDSNILPSITFNKEVLERGQTLSGGWSHGCPNSGYGEVNNVGMVAFMGLAMAKECGMEMDQRALARAIRYFGRYICGGVPYGDATGATRSGRMDNGMCSVGTLAFDYLGEKDIARRWARTVCYMWMARERGHAERLFSFGWGPCGAARASKEEFAMHMNNLIWYYELCRTNEGGLKYLGSSHFPYVMGQTTAIGLPYMLPRKKIYLTGASKSVFAKTPPNAELTKAADLFREKNWKPLANLLAAYTADTSKPGQDYAKELLAAYNRMEQNVKVSLDLAREDIKKSNRKKALARIESVEHLLRLKEPRADIEAVRALLPEVDKPQPRPRKKKIEPQTRRLAFNKNAPPIYDWEFIVPFAKETQISQKESYKVYVAKAESNPELGRWYANDYNASKWLTHRGAIPVSETRQVWVRRTFRTIGKPETYKYLHVLTKGCSGKVYLNGYKLADIRRGEMVLCADAAKALQKGENVLAAHLRPSSGPIDFSLKAGPPVFSGGSDDPFGGDLE